MTSRLDAALAELAAALREEVRVELAAPTGPDRLLSIREAADVLGIGRTALYGEIGAGRLRSVTVGRRRLVPASAIKQRTGTDDTVRPSKESRRAPISPDPLRPAG